MSDQSEQKSFGVSSAVHSNQQNVSRPVYSNRGKYYVRSMSEHGRLMHISQRDGTFTDTWPGEVGDITRAIAAEPSYDRDLLFELFEKARLADRSDQQKLLEMIQDGKSAQQLRAFLDGMLANVGLSELNDQITGRSSDAKRGTEIENDTPPARPRVMDIQYLCGIAPYSVPAKPWTTVTDSDDLVSHLVSLYLTWGYPFFAFFCRETFVKHMRSGQLNSDFCSPFLVNALLANACVSDWGGHVSRVCRICLNSIQFYSDYSEAYSLPGDVKRKGAHFLAEAEQHLRSRQFESGSDIRLASLQATLLLYER